MVCKNADYVALPVTLSNNKKDAKVRIEALSDAMKRIEDASEKTPELKIDYGMVSLSGSEGKRFKAPSWQRESKIEFNLLLPLDSKGNDIYQRTQQLGQFIEKLELPSIIKSRPGKALLVVDNPEKYRRQLLGMISKEVEEYKTSLKSKGKVIIGGLEKPVIIRQIDAQQVELFLDFSMTVELN